MPVCNGLPDGPCPYSVEGKGVHFRYAELNLCSLCEKVRMEINGVCVSEDLLKECNALTKKIEKEFNAKSSQLQSSQRGRNRSTSLSGVGSRSGSLENSQFLIQPVLSYIVYALQRGTAEL